MVQPFLIVLEEQLDADIDSSSSGGCTSSHLDWRDVSRNFWIHRGLLTLPRIVFLGVPLKAVRLLLIVESSLIEIGKLIPIH